MRVNTIEDALTLVLIWVGRSDIPVPPRADSADLPPGLTAVVAVSDALGEGGFTPHHAPLLTTQDRILRPEELRPDTGGYLRFVVEHHGNYQLGYRPGLPDRLFVQGDWLTVPEETVPPGWRTIPMTPEDALINAVLANAFFGLSARLAIRDEPDFDTVPADCPKLVWRHAAMGPHWPGFWTNETRTRLHFGGFGQTLMR